jgi:hypothetical protein
VSRSNHKESTSHWAHHNPLIHRYAAQQQAHRALTLSHAVPQTDRLSRAAEDRTELAIIWLHATVARSAGHCCLSTGRDQGVFGGRRCTRLASCTVRSCTDLRLCLSCTRSVTPSTSTSPTTQFCPLRSVAPAGCLNQQALDRNSNESCPAQQLLAVRSAEHVSARVKTVVYTLHTPKLWSLQVKGHAAAEVAGSSGSVIRLVR